MLTVAYFDKDSSGFTETTPFLEGYFGEDEIDEATKFAEQLKQDGYKNVTVLSIHKCDSCGYVFQGMNKMYCPNCESQEFDDDNLTEEEIEEVSSRWWED